MIKITEEQKKDFMEGLRHVSSFSDSDIVTFRGRARVAQRILKYLSEEPSGEPKSEYAEQEWEEIKDLIKRFEEIDAYMEKRYLQKRIDADYQYFNGKRGILTWLLSVMKLAEGGEKGLFPWAM